MVMSTTSLTPPKCYSGLRSVRDDLGGRGDSASGAPLLAGQPAYKREDDEGVEPVQDADAVHRLADPREHDLERDQQGDGEREQDLPPPEPSNEREQQQEDGAEEDQVTEAGVEAEAVVEGLLADQLAFVRTRLVAEFLGRIEGPVRRAGDLGDDGQPQDRDPVTVDRSQCVQGRSLIVEDETRLERSPVGFGCAIRRSHRLRTPGARGPAGTSASAAWRRCASRRLAADSEGPSSPPRPSRPPALPAGQ